MTATKTVNIKKTATLSVGLDVEELIYSHTLLVEF
jgi:hypothetical protein